MSDLAERALALLQESFIASAGPGGRCSCAMPSSAARPRYSRASVTIAPATPLRSTKLGTAWRAPDHLVVSRSRKVDGSSKDENHAYSET